MKKKFILAALAVAGALNCAAQEGSSSYSVTLDFPYTNKYVFRGVQYARDSIQPSVEIATGPVYLGVWTNQPIVDNTDNEFDFYIGYKQKLNDSWDVDVGATVYYYPELDSSTGGDRATTEGYVGINGNIKGFTPGVYAYYDFDLETTTLQGQLGYSIPVEQAGLSLDLSANVGRVMVKGAGDYSYWSIGANVPFSINEKSTIYVGATYTNSDIDGGERDILNFNAGISVSF